MLLMPAVGVFRNEFPTIDGGTMSFDLEGQRVIVTGAARGIGRAVSRRFAELGAKVSGWDIDPGPISGDAAFVHTAAADVTDEASVDAAFAASKAALGTVSVLIANAGVNGPTKPAWDYTLEDWNHVINVDLTGVFVTTRPAVIDMREKGYGRNGVSKTAVWRDKLDSIGVTAAASILRDDHAVIEAYLGREMDDDEVRRAMTVKSCRPRLPGFCWFAEWYGDGASPSVPRSRFPETRIFQRATTNSL